MTRSRLKIDLIPSYGSSQGLGLDGFLVSISNPSAVKVTLFEITVWSEKDQHPAFVHMWNRWVRRKATPQGWEGGLLKTENYASPTTIGPGETIEFIAPLGAVQAVTGGKMPVRLCVRDGLQRRHFTAARSR